MKPLPIPQREFAFVAETFSLVGASGLDGERLARERDELEAARRASEAAQSKLPFKRTVKKHPVKAKRHARHA
jgi:hypothetical protein